MALMIWLDNNGDELHRETKGKGRPPRGAVRKEDGNFYICQKPEEDKTIYYIVTNSQGQIVKRTPKGRGRPKPGFEKGLDGNWYKQYLSPETLK